jgi:hypothetical protein
MALFRSEEITPYSLYSLFSASCALDRAISRMKLCVVNRSRHFARSWNYMRDLYMILKIKNPLYAPLAALQTTKPDDRSS